MRVFSLGLLGLMLVGAIGCGSGSAPPEPVYPVSGVVTYKGTPVAGADIVFFSREKSRSAFGRTDDKGAFKLTTFTQYDGAVEGQQLVTISKTPPPANTVALPATESDAYEPPGIGKDTMPPPAKSDIPAKYSSQETSGLTAIVNKEGTNEAKFELTD